jgi:hypothetical protein
MAKIITTRMKKIMLKLISENQGGFMQDRQIINNIALVQEAIHSNLENKENGMIIKLDIENAFDHVRHIFLFKVMAKFGFGSSFIPMDFFLY